LPLISLSKDTLDKLDKCLARGKASSAGRAADANKYLLRRLLREALRRYIGDYLFQLEEPKVRRELRSLSETINRFKSELPSDYDAVGRFLFGTYTGSAILREELQPSEAELIALQNAWREHYGSRAISQNLEVMLRNVLAAEECLGKNKPRNHRVKALVRALAEIWQNRTGHWPKSGRDPESATQSGPFADFVRIACSLIPKSSGADKKTLGTAIREVSKPAPRNFPVSKNTM